MKLEDKIKFAKLPNDEQLAIVIAGEARGEKDDHNIPDDESRVLIGSIVLNRIDYGMEHKGWGNLFGKDLFSVITAKDQFTSLSSNDKNYPLMMELVEDFNKAIMKYPWLAICYGDADGLLEGKINRNVQGIYYETVDCHNLWNLFRKRDGKDPEVETVIGHHRVYKTI